MKYENYSTHQLATMLRSRELELAECERSVSRIVYNKLVDELAEERRLRQSYQKSTQELHAEVIKLRRIIG